MQSISGTGALRIGSAYFSKFWTGNRDVYVPDPTWGNHVPIFNHAGLNIKKYRYFDKKTNGLDFNGMCEDLNVSNIKINRWHVGLYDK